MPTTSWSIDDLDVTLTDRGRLGITLSVPGQPPIPIPPMMLGEWPVPVPGRSVVLRTVRNLDAVRFYLLSDGHLVPRGGPRRRRRVVIDTRCARHPDTPAYCACDRCGAFVCKPCSPDGILCVACLERAVQDEVAQARRIRRIGVAAPIILGLMVVGIGLLAATPVLVEGGAALILFTVYVVGRGALAERRDRKQGLPTSLDPK